MKRKKLTAVCAAVSSIVVACLVTAMALNSNQGNGIKATGTDYTLTLDKGNGATSTTKNPELQNLTANTNMAGGGTQTIDIGAISNTANETSCLIKAQSKGDATNMAYYNVTPLHGIKNIVISWKNGSSSGTAAFIAYYGTTSQCITNATSASAADQTAQTTTIPVDSSATDNCYFNLVGDNTNGGSKTIKVTSIVIAYTCTWTPT